MNCDFGNSLKMTVFGSSHHSHVGVIIFGLPKGTEIDKVALQQFLDRRAPGKNSLSTLRKEEDIPIFLSGIEYTNGKMFADGQPLTAVFENTDKSSDDYRSLKNIPRPGHADFTAKMKYGLDFDMSGGGSFSARMTASICLAGGIALQELERKGIKISSRMISVGSVSAIDTACPKDCNQAGATSNCTHGQCNSFSSYETSISEEMQVAIQQARADGDSLGGIIEIKAENLPTGIGGPLFDGGESHISNLLFAIPSVKGVEFGSGFAGACRRGSENNDNFTVKNGKIITTTNNHGGLLGGITSGMPLVVRVAFKPTPSIAKAQSSINLKTLEPVELSIQGRHDPCTALRALPITEASLAFALWDMMLWEKHKTDDIAEVGCAVDINMVAEPDCASLTWENEKKNSLSSAYSAANDLAMSKDSLLAHEQGQICDVLSEIIAGKENTLVVARHEIDAIDTAMLTLFEKRMEISECIADYKHTHGIPIYSAGREAAVLKNISENVSPVLQPHAMNFFKALMDISKERQQEVWAKINGSATVDEEIQFALIGKTLNHSFSKELHGCLADYDYKLLALEENQAYSFIANRRYKGLNITLPYKQLAFSLCDRLTHVAKETETVNVLYFDEGQLVGDNTDYAGFLYMAKIAGIDFDGKSVLILGDGATSKTVGHAVKRKKAADVYWATRKENPTLPFVSYAGLHGLPQIDIIVNTTPVGMFPDNEACLISLDDFPDCQGVLDVVYNPIHTSLVLQAKDRGIKCSGGLPMLVAQATATAEIFLHSTNSTGEKNCLSAKSDTYLLRDSCHRMIVTNKSIAAEEGKPSQLPAELDLSNFRAAEDDNTLTAFAVSRIKEITESLKKNLRNIVLIGMPGCGKTTYGRAAAAALGLPFADIDEEITKDTGLTPTEIFERYGQDRFRSLETAKAQELGKKNGMVISTGGGTVLDPDNMNALRQNGTIIFIDCPLEFLETKGRPLSKDAVALQKLYDERLPLYQKYNDYTVYIHK